MPEPRCCSSPIDPNERFRERRRQTRRRRRACDACSRSPSSRSRPPSRRSGMTFLNGWGGQEATTPSRSSTSAAGGRLDRAEPTPQPAPLPDEIRGVHVTAALASLDGKLDEYLSLDATQGLTALELDVKDENGEVGFARQRAGRSPARSAPPGRSTTRARRRQTAEAAGVYLIGRVVVFEDPILATKRPAARDQAPRRRRLDERRRPRLDEPVRQARLEVQRRRRRRGREGRLRRDHVRLRSLPDRRRRVGRGVPAASARSRRPSRSRTSSSTRDQRLEPLGARVSAAVFGLTATREMGIGQRPRQLAQHLDAIYPMVYPSHFGPGEYSLDDPNARTRASTVARALRDFRRDAPRARHAARPVAPGLLARPRLQPRRRPRADPRRPATQRPAGSSSGTRAASTGRLPLAPDPRRRADIHRVCPQARTGLCGKCGKMNFPQIARNAISRSLASGGRPSRFPLAPSTERE